QGEGCDQAGEPPDACVSDHVSPLAGSTGEGVTPVPAGWRRTGRGRATDLAAAATLDVSGTTLIAHRAICLLRPLQFGVERLERLGSSPTIGVARVGTDGRGRRLPSGRCPPPRACSARSWPGPDRPTWCSTTTWPSPSST